MDKEMKKRMIDADELISRCKEQMEMIVDGKYLWGYWERQVFQYCIDEIKGMLDE